MSLIVKVLWPVVSGRYKRRHWSNRTSNNSNPDCVVPLPRALGIFSFSPLHTCCPTYQLSLTSSHDESCRTPQHSKDETLTFWFIIQGLPKIESGDIISCFSPAFSWIQLTKVLSVLQRRYHGFSSQCLLTARSSAWPDILSTLTSIGILMRQFRSFPYELLFSSLKQLVIYSSPCPIELHAGFLLGNFYFSFFLESVTSYKQGLSTHSSLLPQGIDAHLTF